MTDRAWIIGTLLDVEASDGEVQAAAAAATPSELRCVRQELDLSIWWCEMRSRDARGRMAHLREQWPGIDRQPPL